MRTVYKSSIDFKRCSTALGQYLHKQKEKKNWQGAFTENKQTENGI